MVTVFKAMKKDHDGKRGDHGYAMVKMAAAVGESGMYQQVNSPKKKKTLDEECSMTS